MAKTPPFGRPGLTWARGPPATRAASVTGGDMIQHTIKCMYDMYFNVGI